MQLQIEKRKGKAKKQNKCIIIEYVIVQRQIMSIKTNTRDSESLNMNTDN